MNRRLLLWGALALLPTAAAAQGDCYQAGRSKATPGLAVIGVRWTAAPTTCPLPRPRIAVAQSNNTLYGSDRVRPIRANGSRADFADGPRGPNLHRFDRRVDHPVTHKVSAYIGAGYDRVQPQFHLNYTNSMGDRERRRHIRDLDEVVLFGGGTWQPSPRLSTSGEVYVSPDDAIAVRLLVRRAF